MSISTKIIYERVSELLLHWRQRTDTELIMAALAELLESIEYQNDGQLSPYIRALRTELSNRIGKDLIRRDLND